MKARLALAAVAIVAANVFSEQSRASSSQGVLTARPFEGHTGDNVYLSGYNLTPRKRLTIYWACPAWYTRTFGNLHIRRGPQTNSRGQFAGFRLQVIPLLHFASSGCQIYVNDPDPKNQYGPAFPATYTILAPGQRAAPCARKMCVGVKSFPGQIRAGFQERIDVQQGWPGARGDVVLSYPWAKTQRRKVSLDAHGNATVRFRIVSRIARPGMVRVRVRLKLGRSGGHGTAHFIVLR